LTPRGALVALLATAALLTAFGGSASATYVEGTPLDTNGVFVNVTSAAVNQSTRDVYASIPGTTLTNVKGKVFRFSSAGSEIACAPNTPAPSFPGSVAVNPKNGDLFVLDTAANKANARMRVYGESGCGAQKAEWLDELSSGMMMPQMATDSAGNVYVPNAQVDKVEKFTETGTASILVEPLNNPSAAALDSAGNVYVAAGAGSCNSNATGRLTKYTAAGVEIALPAGLAALENVLSVAVDKATGQIFVGRGCGADKGLVGGFRVEKYSADGTTKLDEFGAGLFANTGSTIALNQIAIDETSGDVYVTDPGNKKVKVFEPEAAVNYTLSVSKTGSGTGTVTSSPAGINCGSECSAEYESGTEVTLSASEDPGSLFTGWSGAGCSGSGECKVTMTEAKSVSANFAPAFALTLTKEGGEGTVVSNPAGINCGGACSASFESGKALVLTASPAAGYLFVSWKGCDTGGANGRQCTVTMSKAKAVVAKFIPSYTIAVSKEGPGLGKVQSSPGGLLCLNNCSATSAEFKAGASVALSAVAAKHFHLVKWTGDCSGNGACSFPAIAASHTVGAEFAEDQQFSLTVNKEGGGNGTVKSSLAGISCGATCPTMSASYYTGVEVELTATPGKGSALKEWTGACTGSGACKVTMSEAKTVGAKFE